MATIVLTGGGTGGHVMPLLALLPQLREKFRKILFIGGDGMEKKLAENAGLPFYRVSTVRFDRTNPFKNYKIPFVLHKGIAECVEIFEKEKPDVVLSKGGYVALPSCFAAKKLGIPVVCHESDYTLGLANKVVSRFAEKVLTSFEDTPGEYTGSPIREEIYSGSKARALQKYPFRSDKKTVLVFGGSQGASALNKVIYDAMPELTERYNVLHISGKSGDFSVPDSPSYRQVEFATDIFDLYALSDIVVCRAGANTLFELAAIGKPAVCIPLPKGNSRGDQVLNASYFSKKGYVDVLPQEDLFIESLLYKLSEVQSLHPPILDMSKNNERIADKVFSVIK